jgi:hypothetical protein
MFDAVLRYRSPNGGLISKRKSPLDIFMGSAVDGVINPLIAAPNDHPPTPEIQSYTALAQKKSRQRAGDRATSGYRSRTGDSATGDFSDAQVIRTFGDVPAD